MGYRKVWIKVTSDWSKAGDHGETGLGFLPPGGVVSNRDIVTNQYLRVFLDFASVTFGCSSGFEIIIWTNIYRACHDVTVGVNGKAVPPFAFGGSSQSNCAKTSCRIPYRPRSQRRTGLNFVFPPAVVLEPYRRTTVPTQCLQGFLCLLSRTAGVLGHT